MKINIQPELYTDGGLYYRTYDPSNSDVFDYALVKKTINPLYQRVVQIASGIKLYQINGYYKGGVDLSASWSQVPDSYIHLLDIQKSNLNKVYSINVRLHLFYSSYYSNSSYYNAAEIGLFEQQYSNTPSLLASSFCGSLDSSGTFYNNSIITTKEYVGPSFPILNYSIYQRIAGNVYYPGLNDWSGNLLNDTGIRTFQLNALMTYRFKNG